VIKLPPNLSDPLFNEKFERGAVVKTIFRCKDGKDKYKFFIILNKDITIDPILFILTTSQLEFYNKNPHFNKDIIRIPAGTLSFFSKETIINCREIHKIPKDKLRENFKNSILQIEGKLPENIINDIDKIIEKSFLVSPKDKEAILGKKS